MSANKAKGTAFESLLVPVFGAYVPDAIRHPLVGTADKGDLFLPGERRYVVEAKHHARMDLAGWAAEAEREARNAGVPHWLIVHKRVGKGRGEDQWVTTSLGHMLPLIYS